MTTSTQAAASRQNGALSHGPKTEAGKAASSRNAIRHGLCSSRFRLDDPQEHQAFERLKLDLARTWSAVDEAQCAQIEQMAIATWRQGVVANVEQALWSAVADGVACAETGGDGLPSINSINRYRARIERDLKLAKASLIELQERRVKAIELEIAKAKELSSQLMLRELEAELGPEGFAMFKHGCTNEPEAAVVPAPLANEPAKPEGNRASRRRAEKLAQKGKCRK